MYDDQEQIVPDLPQMNQAVITPIRSSGTTTPNGILMTTKYARGASLLTSGTVTPLPELVVDIPSIEEADTLIRKMDKKHVRFLAPCSDEENAAKPKLNVSLNERIKRTNEARLVQ